jgi:hypothetical protein
MTNKTKNPSVLIAVPSHSFWEADFGMSMLGLVASSVNPPEGFESLSIGVQNTKGSILPNLRQHLVRKAIEMEATHILFVDSDMTFPSWMLHRLLEARRPVVAANCVTKSLPPSPTARMRDGTKHGKVLSQLDYRSDTAQEYVGVWRVGTGIMLIETNVFEKLEQPWFPLEWDEELGEVVGEDWGFCKRCEEAGIPIVVDTLLSHTIGHVGRLEYHPDMLQVNTK